MVEWIDDAELIAKTIGDIREMLAYEDADETFESWLINHGWIASDEYDEYEEDGDWGEEDLDDEYIIADVEFTPEETTLIFEIAHDIADGKYTIDAVRGAYSNEMIRAIEEVLD